MRRTGLLLVLAALLAAFFALDLGRFLTLESLQTERVRLLDWYRDDPVLVLGGYMGIYIVAAALSVPGALVLTLMGGAVFGTLVGTVAVSFASSIGATLAFLAARFFLRDTVRRHFVARLAAIDAGVAQDGAFYLFAVRLVPLFPFFAVNLLFGLTPVKTRTFYAVSQLGMLPATLVFVNAGARLGELTTLSGLLAPELLAAFTLLGVFPLLARKILEWIKSRQVYRAWNKPHRYDRNLIVVGAGAAGLSCAYLAAALKARVTLIERAAMGGDCLNTGCVPSKALLRSARFIAEARACAKLGVAGAALEFDFAAVMARVKQAVAAVAPHDSIERYTDLGVEVLSGDARLVDPWTVAVNGRRLTARAIVLATGATPFVPPLPGLEQVDYLTSDTVWDLNTLPQRLLILGGGPIGCELAQAFARLGSAVTLVEQAPRILPREDADIAAYVAAALTADGVQLCAGHTARALLPGLLHCVQDDAPVALGFERILIALGRRARTDIPGLDALGLVVTRHGTFAVNEYLQTRYPHLYAAGDCVGPYQFTHAASHQAGYATLNALFAPWKRFKADYRVLPACTYTDPECARVGLSEDEARARGVAYEVTRYELAELDRAIADAAAHGVVKILTVPGNDRILGVAIASAHAGELIAEYALALRHGLGLNKILGTVHAYPTWAEANKHAAGVWRRAHAPVWALAWLGRWHARGIARPD